MVELAGIEPASKTLSFNVICYNFIYSLNKLCSLIYDLAAKPYPYRDNSFINSSLVHLLSASSLVIRLLPSGISSSCSGTVISCNKLSNVCGSSKILYVRKLILLLRYSAPSPGLSLRRILQRFLSVY